MVKKYNPKGSKKNIRRYVDELKPSKSGSTRNAIAIQYDKNKGKAPRIVATGKGAVADKILAVAEENRIPFYEDDALANLLSKLELDSEIAPELYVLVAEVLAFVFQLDQKAKKQLKRGGPSPK
jgi:flagellar biosynthesis protein